MPIFLSHRSALKFWRQNGHNLTHALAGSVEKQTSITVATINDGNVQVLSKERIANNSPSMKIQVTREMPPGKVPDYSLLIKAYNLGATFPIDVLCSKQAMRHNIKRIKQHTLSIDAPSGSFIKVRKDVVVCSPELCFLQMATLLELPKLIMLGYELCGTYSLLSTSKLKKRDALTTTQKIRAYVTKMSGAHGHTKAMRALSYIQNGAESPMETRLAMLLTLPYKLGGYGFPFPDLNHVVSPTKSARANANKTHYRCDLFWLDKKLDVEYDSDTHHLGRERIAADAIRRNALISLGVTVVVVTRTQFYDLRQFDKLARQIASLLGRRLRYVPEEFMCKHKELRKMLNDV